MNQPPEAGDRARWESTIATINDSPFYRLLGMEVVAMGGGYARLILPVNEKLMQLYGTVHGGATASLADSAVGTALISTNAEDEKAFTVELKLNFLAPVTHGLLTAEAQLFHRGKTIAVADVEVRNSGGRLVAKGIATYMPVKA